jgi:DNA-directed RNA polymerase subunit RPC12/RpoP
MPLSLNGSEATMVTIACPHCGHERTLMERTVFRLKVKGSVKLRCTNCKRNFYVYVEKEKSDNNPVSPTVLSALNIGLETWRRIPPEKREQIRKLVEKGSVALARHILKMSLLRTSLLKPKP